MQLTTPLEITLDPEALDHEDLAELLMECVLQERDHIAALDLDGMQSWTERREALTRQVISLAREEAIGDGPSRLYERVHQIAAENLDILKGAHTSLKQLIDGLQRPPVALYDTKGKAELTEARAQGILSWRG